MTPLSIKNRLRSLKHIFNARWLYVILLAGMLFPNTSRLFSEITRLTKLRQLVPYAFLGIKFSGLEDILSGVKYIGYFTDKDLDDRKSAMQFTQAQYVLAPIILDLNNTDHKFILFDCSDPELAMEKINEIGARALRKNQFGIILATNPRAQPPSGEQP